MQHFLQKVALASALGLTLGAATACAPVVTQRGYIPDPERIASIQVGVDDKTTISERLGSPSNVATFDSDTWYYISSREEQFVFFHPEPVKRDILAISFNPDGRVAGIEHYGLKDGQVFAFSDNITPTKGRELTFLQQMFGNLGRGLPGGGGEEGK
ncbi:MAG: outer membrane protein assembly factor BamE [Alphaproteobacteria bacterium]|nr:outer membrane protein assembly factor BamE [Alphaproteobacteria bacterium]